MGTILFYVLVRYLNGWSSFWKEHAKLKISRESFNIDTAKLWNQVQPEIKNAESIGLAKARIKKLNNFAELWKFNSKLKL